MIVGMLAILKAGGAYVPIDPSQPAERVSFLIEDAAPKVVLVQRRFMSALPSSKARVVPLEMDFPPSETRIQAQKPGPDNLAYVMFTSGSTGRPKGVCVPHRGITRLVKNTNYARFGPGETFLQLAAQVFDASTFEIWGALLNGARLVVPPPTQPSLSDMGKWIKEGKITTLWLTAGLFHQMVEEQLDSLQGLRQLLAGGDVLSPAHVGTAVRSLPQCRIINGYGPTENTTFTCCHPVGESEVKRARVSIGRPVANTTVYILDENLQPVPIGVPGELYAGGDGLAHGYLNRPDLTSEKFVRDPFSDRPGARLYKTGDVCRYLRDGRIEFLGRMDHQVKIRGFRVELGEIETNLDSHPDVLQSVVILREEKPGDKRLVAYVVPVDAASRLNVAELLEFLKKRVPNYMLPAAFVPLEELPLNPSGKIDRKALPAPDLSHLGLDVTGGEPRDEKERQLAVIWAEILGVDRVGVHDNFFDLGGHSFLILRLQGALQKAFGVAISMEVIFGNPTIAELSVVIRGTRVSTRPARIPAGPPETGKPPLFFLHFLTVARRLEKLFQTERKVCAVCSPFEEAMQEWRETGRLDLTIQELAARDIQIIKSLQPSGPYHLAGYCFGGMVAFEAACQLRNQGERVASLTLIDAFYPPGCPPLRFARIRGGLEHFAHLSRKGPAYFFNQLGKRIHQAAARFSNTAASQKHSHKPGALLRRIQEAFQETNESERFQGAMAEAYRANLYEGPTLLFRGVARRLSWGREPGPANGWDQVVLNGLRVESLRCDHAEIYNEPHLVAIARSLRNYLLRHDPVRKAGSPPAARHISARTGGLPPLTHPEQAPPAVSATAVPSLS
jgi:aspartate racemase